MSRALNIGPLLRPIKDGIERLVARADRVDKELRELREAQEKLEAKKRGIETAGVGQGGGGGYFSAKPGEDMIAVGGESGYWELVDKSTLGGGGAPTGPAGGVLSGTYPNPGFAADMATQAELDAHLNDTSDAHDASAVSILDAAGDFTATDVEGALAELAAGSSDIRFAANVGDGVTTSITLTHNLNSRDLDCRVYRNASPWDEVFPTVRHTSVNTMTLVFLLAPAMDAYRAVVH